MAKSVITLRGARAAASAASALRLTSLVEITQRGLIFNEPLK